MAINIKFTKFDNTSWGFRLAGGSDFPQPLTVIRVMEGSLAECMGLKVGDVVVRLNDQSISSLTHGQAHEALVHAGNNFVLGVQREEEARKAAEAISEENIVPYKIALADLPPVFPEQILKEETVIERYEEENTAVEPLSAEDEIRQEEVKLAEEKPVDANSEIVSNKNLTDDEIAQLILEEEELLSDKGLLGVNFKKLKPRASILKDSKVLEELQHIAVAEPERVQELKRTSTFLQKPQRPVPKSKNEPKVEEDEGETYKVVIKKQDKKTVITRLVEKGLLPPGSEATVARTPEPPPVPSEVKMHETETRVEENRPPAVSNLNSTCSTCSLDNTDSPLSTPPRPLESNSNKSLTSDNQLAHHINATYKCESFMKNHVKPNQSRRCSATGRYDEVGARSSHFKGRYVENIIRRYSRPCVLSDQQIDELTNIKSGSAYSGKYDWLKTIGFWAKPKRTRIFARRMKGRYLATYLRRESIRLMYLITTLFQFLLQISGVSESSNSSKIRERRRSSFKGRYLENVLHKNVAPVLECVKETYFNDDQEKKNGQQTDKNAFELNISEWRENGPCCALQKESSLIINTSHNPDLNEEETVEDDRNEENNKCLEMAKFTDTIPEEEDTLSKFLQSAENYVSTEVFHRGSRRLSKSRKSIDVTSKEDDSALSKFLQSAEDYVSAEVFHRHSRRFSKPRKSIDVTSEEDDSALSKFLQSAEDYVSAEVFHRRSRRFSKPRKSIDVTSEEDDGALSKFLQSAENYVSAEVFHRRSRRFSKPRKSIDVTSKEDDNALSKFLQSAEDYVSAEVFHRRSRRFSKPRKSIDMASEEDDGALSKFLQSAEDYVSTEVFHRGSRRLSRSLKREENGEEDVLSSVLRSTGNYVSNEVFHRRSSRLSRRSSRRESVSLVSPGLWGSLKSINFSLPWFSFTEKNTEGGDCDEKIDSEIECDDRRLSFVPTILYKGITSHIGIDFTKLVVYAFIPCTSIILLYMYN
ncbi:uncharacterized protein LOC105202662 isoform X1 [Solenopsis invicta]|uniref:uncharacterized protein LOC105202662 isoform X1 n=1 Tax=Solenopsis invicta TaxID=13686 RepID=UPI000E33E565|nr:uncharacterized protein LOC105202662 isoform X1 [Solenopsis invicta]XP_039311624.1 uncharacterized protein LOC105202662 isoform X1 [Solenopsis invicta]